jgi:hypothetical protein
VGVFVSVAEPSTAFWVGAGGLALLAACFASMIVIRKRKQLAVSR